MNSILPNPNNLKIMLYFLKEELGRYFQQYRELLISHGIIPIHRIGIPALTKEELKKAEEYNLRF